MKVLNAGYKYELQNLDNKDTGQVIQFIEKIPVGAEFVTVNDGTTNEELAKVLINRIEFLNNKAPCRENSLAVTKFQEGLMWLEARTKERQARGVENTPAK